MIHRIIAWGEGMWYRTLMVCMHIRNKSGLRARGGVGERGGVREVM